MAVWTLCIHRTAKNIELIALKTVYNIFRVYYTGYVVKERPYMKGCNVFLLTGCFVCNGIKNLLKHNPLI